MTPKVSASEALAHPLVRAIQIFIEWYRREYSITIGSVHAGGDELGASGEMIELLARAEFGLAPWNELADAATRHEIFAYVAHRVEYYRSRGMINAEWDKLPSWQTCSEMLELLRYIWAFRFYHNADPDQPREFRYDDLGDMGQLLLGSLVNTHEFEGDWQRLAHRGLLAASAEFARKVCWPRLEAYRIRKGLGPLPNLVISMSL